MGVSDRRLHALLTQEAKIASDFFFNNQGNFCVYGLCQRSEDARRERRAFSGKHQWDRAVFPCLGICASKSIPYEHRQRGHRQAGFRMLFTSGEHRNVQKRANSFGFNALEGENVGKVPVFEA